MQIITPQMLGRGFGLLNIGTPIETFDQYWHTYNDGSQGWRLGYYMTSEARAKNIRANERVPYCRPLTLRAKMSVLWPVAKKVWRCKVIPLFGPKA